MRILLVAILLVSCIQAVAACEGQKGKVIFEDTFADDAGGWIFSNDGFVFKAPGAEARVGPSSGIEIHNQTFYATEGDYCIEIAFPKDQPSRRFGVGIKFLISADGQTYFIAAINNVGVMQFYRHSAEGINLIWNVDQQANVKMGPGEFNAIESIVKDNVITVLLNGTLVKTVRAQTPAGNLKFGIHVEAGTNATDGGAFPVKSFKVTESRKLAPDAKTSP